MPAKLLKLTFVVVAFDEPQVRPRFPLRSKSTELSTVVNPGHDKTSAWCCSAYATGDTAMPLPASGVSGDGGSLVAAMAAQANKNNAAKPEVAMAMRNMARRS